MAALSLVHRSLSVFKDRRKIFELLVGLALLFLMSLIAYSRALDPFEMLFLDWRFQLRGERPFRQDITLVAIEEASLDKFGRWPWPRDKHALLMGLLQHKAFRPSVVGFDVLFENENPALPQGDEALVYHTKSFQGRAIMAYFFEQGPESIYERNEVKEKILEGFALTSSSNPPEKLSEADKVSLPFLELSKVSSLAFVNTPVDHDGRTRRSQLLWKYQGKIYPSLDLLAALYYLGAKIEDVRVRHRAVTIENERLGRRVIPIEPDGSLLINYYGGFQSISGAAFIELLEAGADWVKGGSPHLLKSKLKDKIVLIGLTAQGFEDRRVTPFRQYEPGITLHAQTIANLLDQSYLTRARPWISYTALSLFGILIIFTTMSFRITVSLPLMIGAGILYFFAAHVFFLNGLWIDVAIHEASMVVLFIGITSFRYFTTLEELKRTQEQLIQSTKMASLGQLSAGIAHEFRNILNAINLHVEVCSRPETTPERMVKYMGVIKDIMVSANMILNGLLTFARKSESVRKAGDMKKTVQDTLLLIEKEMMRHQIEVKAELEDVQEISYDAGQISQVIMNLMNNSRDAFKDREEGRTITMVLKNDPKGVRLDMGDNGSGIPPQVLKRLFEPFVTSKPAGKGTGLGLSVCHGIIRNHGGEITVTTAQGKGTTWHIFLPKT